MDFIKFDESKFSSMGPHDKDKFYEVSAMMCEIYNEKV